MNNYKMVFNRLCADITKVSVFIKNTIIFFKILSMDREFFKKSYFSLFSTSIVYYYFRVLILPSRALRKLQCMYICNDNGCIFHMHPCCICMYICDVHAELTHCFLTTIRITKKKAAL